MDSYDKMKISEDDSKKITLKTVRFVLITFMTLTLFLYLFVNSILRSVATSAFLTCIATFFYFDNLLSKAVKKSEKD